MIRLLSLSIFILVIAYNLFPGYFLYSLLQKNKKNIWIETLIFSILLSFAVNILFMHISKLIKLKIEPIVALIYLLLFLILSSKRFFSSKFEKLRKYEKYTLFLFLGYFIVFGSFLLFGYTGNKYGDFVDHVNNLKADIEEKQLSDYHHYLNFKAVNGYPKGFSSILAMPFLLFQNNDALIIAQVLTLFSRLIPIFFAFLIFLASILFINSDKVGFYASFIFLGLDFNILLPIYWGGLPTNFSRLLMFAVFLLLWYKLREIKSFSNPILIAAILSATALTIRPDITVYFPIMLVSFFVFFKKFGFKLFKILSYYGILTIFISIIFYLQYIYLYTGVLTETTAVSHNALILGLFNWRRFIPLIPFLFLAFFSLKDKRAYPLTSLGFSFIILIPLLIWINPIYISLHIFTTLTIPFSVICGLTLDKLFSNKKWNKNKILQYVFYFGVISLFLAVNIRQHYLVNVPLQEKELTPIYWIKNNTANNSMFFYLFQKGFHHKYDVPDTMYYTAQGLQQLIAPFAERNALSMFSAYSPQLTNVSDQFTIISQGLENNSISNEELLAFLNNNKFTHVLLLETEYEQFKRYFKDFKVIYNDNSYIVLTVPN